MANKFLLEFSLLAQQDIDDIFAYTLAQWGERQFGIYKSKIGKALATLLEKPTCSHENPEHGLRMFSVERHRIFYNIDGKTIFIVRVLHERMDPSLYIADPGEE